jgi:hypothetical protein
MKRSPLRRQANTEKRRLELHADRLWALLILARAWNRCEHCHRPFCQAAHIIPRRHKHYRHHPDNGIALCPKCHTWADQHTPAFREWLGYSYPLRHAMLARRHEVHGPVTAAMLTEKIAQLKSALRAYCI